MRNSTKIVISVAIIVVILGSVAMLRKDFSSDIEVILRDGIVSVIHNNTMSTRDLFVEVLVNRNTLRLELPATRKVVDIPISNSEKNFKIKISRKDLFGRIRYKPVTLIVPTIEKPYVVLVGASVGNAWEFTKLPLRREIDNIILGFRYKNVFDKEDVIQSLVALRSKPNVIIIKECAAYFPRGTKEGLHNIELWVESLRNHGIVPALATTVPVTAANDRRNVGRQESINRFNEAIRFYAAGNSMFILDLQKALGDGTPMGYLRNEYSDADGLHLNPRAYSEALDPLMVSFLDAWRQGTTPIIRGEGR